MSRLQGAAIPFLCLHVLTVEKSRGAQRQRIEISLAVPGSCTLHRASPHDTHAGRGPGPGLGGPPELRYDLVEVLVITECPLTRASQKEVRCARYS